MPISNRAKLSMVGKFTSISLDQRGKIQVFTVAKFLKKIY